MKINWHRVLKGSDMIMGNCEKDVSVRVPENMRESGKHLFINFLTYKLHTLVIKNVNNAIVTYNGLCLHEGNLLRECHHWYPEYYDAHIKQAALYCEIIQKYPQKLIQLVDDSVYLLIHHPWYNYYHWLCDCIPRLWLVRQRLGSMRLILPEYYKTCDFINGTLAPFDRKDIYYIPSLSCLQVQNLCMPQIKPIVDSYDAVIMKQIRLFYLQYVLRRKDIRGDVGDRIYVSRKKAARKKVINEDQLETILCKYNFKIVCNEDYTFMEQVAIFSNATILVSIHGAGLTNMIFMKENSKVLEFHKARTNEGDRHSRAFWYLADCLGHNYFIQICQPTDVNADYLHADIIVDPATLEEDLKLMLSGQHPE